MKKTKLQLLLLLLFIGGLIILPQKAKAAEKAADIIPVNISVKYGQTEARTILDMINEARTNSEYTWYWNMDDTTKTYCTDLKELKYDYDLERVAMKRAAEIALSYDHERPMGGYAWDTYKQENISYRYTGENIAAGQTTAFQVNDVWREDNEPYGGQGHRRNMLSSKFNCVGIGHVYYNGVHYWVEEFAYRPEINTTKVLAKDSTETVSVSVDKKKIKNVYVTFDQDAYSLRIGQSTTPAIKETRIGVEYFWSGGRGFAPVLDTPVVSIADSSVASYSNKTLSGLKEGTTELTATLYGITASGSATVSVHDCENHWDTGSVTKKPTCTEPGEKTFACSICKSTKKESVPATGHAYASVWTIDRPATCEKAGTESRHCTNENCTATTEPRSIAALGHSWKDNKDGTATCTRDGCTETHKHKWDSGEITTEPTCTAQGERTYHCTYEENGICTATKTEAVKKLGHRYILIKKEAPTCESDGILYGKCSRCSKIITKQDAKNPALGHDWKDNGNGTATCTRNGCKATHTHKWDSGTITTKPTCTAKGERTYHCTYEENGICTATKTEAVNVLDHKYVLAETEAPTCENDGVLHYKCESCSETKTEKDTENPALGHLWNDNGNGTATCIRDGCMETHSHERNSGTITKKPTCTTKGEKVYCCTYTSCPYEEKETLEATGHKNKRIRNKKTATCKAEGYTGDTYCRTCNTLLEEGKVLPKLEHQWNDGTVTKRATYETAGELTYRCRKCAAKRIISLEKLAYPKAGTSYTISGNEYKISKPGAEVILVRTSKTTKNVTVPAQIYAQGITYKVTSIGAKAFNNNKKLTKVTIGTNIVKINSNVFFNCKNLKTVIIKSVRLTGKTANKKAFKNAHKKLVIRVPKKVKKIYKQIFKGLKVK